jgi:hypothetical protein
MHASVPLNEATTVPIYDSDSLHPETYTYTLNPRSQTLDPKA